MDLTKHIPKHVLCVMKKLEENGHEAFLAGGCVRDILLNLQPKDYDIATSALPQQVRNLFPLTIPTGLKHGTVTVEIPDKPTAYHVEVTTYRVEKGYSDNRRPDKVEFVRDIMQDLMRRDFTINAIAWNPKAGIRCVENAMQDLDRKRIRAVGEADDRFAEDALRMMRAFRFMSLLDFNIEFETKSAIRRNAWRIQNISAERIRSELCKMLVGNRWAVSDALHCMLQFGLFSFIVPEFLQMKGLKQNPLYHKWDVWSHTLKVVENTPPNLKLKLLALFHDVGKPATVKNGKFINHEKVGAEMTAQIMRRLKFSNKEIEWVTHCVEHHMVPVHQKMGESALRRWVQKVGEDFVDKLAAFRVADLIGTGRFGRGPAESLVKGFVERAKTVWNQTAIKKESDLAIDGHRIMELLGVGPGPIIGKVKEYLVGLVNDKPEMNNEEDLIKCVKFAQISLMEGQN